jgi:hypothetical protein
MCKTFAVNLDELSQSRLLAEGERPLIGRSGMSRSDGECDQLMFWYSYTIGEPPLYSPRFRIVRVGMFEGSFES